MLFFFFSPRKKCAGHEKSSILFEVEEQFLIIGTKMLGEFLCGEFKQKFLPI